MHRYRPYLTKGNKHTLTHWQLYFSHAELCFGIYTWFRQILKQVQDDPKQICHGFINSALQMKNSG